MFSMVLGLKKEKSFKSTVFNHENIVQFENYSDNSKPSLETSGFFILDGVPKEETPTDGTYIGILKRTIISKKGFPIPIIKNYLFSPLPESKKALAEFFYTISLLSPAKARAMLAILIYSSQLYTFFPYNFDSDPFFVSVLTATLMLQDKNQILFPSKMLLEKYTQINFSDYSKEEIPTLVKNKINTWTAFPDLLKLLDLSDSDLTNTCLHLLKIYKNNNNQTNEIYINQTDNPEKPKEE